MVKKIDQKTVALGEKEKARQIIDALPKEHPFEVRYTRVEKVNWDSCALVLSAEEKKRILKEGRGKKVESGG